MTNLLFTAQLTIPALEVFLLILVSTLALLFGRFKLGLLINFCFSMYWGFILNIDLFTDHGGQMISSFTYLYFGFGLAMLVLATIGFFFQKG